MSIVYVRDLIAELQKLNPDLPVNIYCEDDTYWIDRIDATKLDRVDINCFPLDHDFKGADNE